MSNFLDFNDVKVKSDFKDRYKGIAGESHRISIIYPKPDGDNKQGPFLVENTHFHEKYFVCKDGICCEKLGPSKQRFACLVVKYKTDKNALFKRDENGKPVCNFEVLEWVFTVKKFKLLKSLHDEWDPSSIDIKVTCGDNETYQDLSFTPCKESAWQSNVKLKEAVYKEAAAMRPNLHRSLGQDLNISEIKQLLGLEDTSASDVISSNEDLSDILEEV